MPHFISQWSFTAAQAKALVDNPQDREAAARRLVEAFGGRLVGYYFMIGERASLGNSSRGAIEIQPTDASPR